MKKVLKALVGGVIAVVSMNAMAAPKTPANLPADVYGIAGIGFNGYSSAVSPITIEVGAGKLIKDNISAEVTANITPGGDVDDWGYGTCKVSLGVQFGVSARGIYHIPVDLGKVKPYVGAGLGFYKAPSSKLTGCGFADAYSYNGASGVGVDYTAGIEYPMNDKTKLYVDLGGFGSAWGGTAGAKIKF